MEDHYATLGVRPAASAEEIRRAYRRLARAHHPDLLRGATPEARRRSEERLKRVNRAHQVLGDRERRLAYDRERSRAAARPPVAPTYPRARHPEGPRPTPLRPHAAPPPAARTTHWGAGGPIDVEWAAPPPRAPRPDTDIFSTARLVRYAAAIIVFAVLLAALWRPDPDPSAAPARTPIVITAPTPVPNPAPVPTTNP